MRFHKFLLLMLSLGLAGCSQIEPVVVTRVVQVFVTATPSVGLAGGVVESGSSATATPTPAPTPTPTPTAPPVTVLSNPELNPGANTTLRGGAPCGVADWLDFPLNPPDGAGASGGGDFGVFRGRFEKFHAGEDWGLGSRANFGSPVYSIGTGIVTYAQPLGWGVDQGVVIVRHVLPGGRAIYSFYGHLDPPSITLRAGDCVLRGDQVGRIGRPRGWPHLHFEIRTHMPDVPGPGYWPTDPIRAGWLPPSAFIWDERIKALPDVQWTRMGDGRVQEAVGLLQDDSLVVMKDQALIAISLENGTERWRWQPEASDDTDPFEVDTAVVAAGGDGIYAADQLGGVRLLEFGEAPSGPAGEFTYRAPAESWQIDLDSVGVPVLIPLPDGGLVVSTAGGMVGLSRQGRIIWELDEVPRAAYWVPYRGGLIVSTSGEGQLWLVGGTGPVRLAALGGMPAVVQDTIYLYRGSQVFRLAASGGEPELIMELPESYSDLGAFAALPDGSLLLAHRDRQDHRLLLLDGQGSLQWEWSLADLDPGQAWIIQGEGDTYLLLESRSGARAGIDLYALEQESGVLKEVFRGGTRTPRSSLTLGLPLSDGRILIQIGGGSLAMLKPGAQN